MKLLHLEISECRECPFRYGASDPGYVDGVIKYNIHRCWHAKREPIVPDSGIPAWCPLSDAKEEKK
jgi:hypothetical protein